MAKLLRRHLLRAGGVLCSVSALAISSAASAGTLFSLISDVASVPTAAVASIVAGGNGRPQIGGAAPAPIASSAEPILGTIQPVSGDLSPLYGRINPFYGDVNSSYGRINPFYGRINPFYGRINPFFGDVSGFWGRINPFTQTADAATLAFYGKDFDAFWGSANPYKDKAAAATYGKIATFWSDAADGWNSILPQWNSASTTSDAVAVAALIQGSLLGPAVKFWNPLIKAGKQGSSADTLIRARLAEGGVTFNRDGSIDPASLLTGSPSDRAMLFLNLYDDLMDYAGTGHVDWWMARTGWSPALAETQGKAPVGGTTPTIGMIDFAMTVPTDAAGKPGPLGKHLSKQVIQYGSNVYADGHGAAVGSLIIGATDGSGVLGVLPKGAGTVVVYDPYDDTGTTNWTDVGTGVRTLVKSIFDGRSAPLGVLNASLGVPGWTLHPGWNDALADAGAHDHNLVVAAGNDGITQTENVPWDFANNPTLLIVGSVGADGTISNFSNRPGEACLIRGNASGCTEADKLKYRFIVAPGELILVSDGVGGHMRQSGTSLAAPIVSGAIALLQNRWPWLSRYPDETATIIVKSATPRGTNPGADPVYGAGELNIAASQAPLRFDTLVYYQVSNGLILPLPMSLSNVVSKVRSGNQQSWDASNLAFTALEKIGGTYRDFQIPLSSRLVGQNTITNAGGQAYQSFLASALRAQAGRFAALTMTTDDASAPVYGLAAQSPAVGRIGGATLRVRVTPAEIGNAFRLSNSNRFETHAALVSDQATLQFGFGQGAAALGTTEGFGYRSDYEAGKGGANPLLGLASGGAYFAGRAAIAPGLTLTVGTTARNSIRNLSLSGVDHLHAGSSINRYAAGAQTVAIAYRMGALTARAAVTRLDERAALLGIQSVDDADLHGGSETRGATMGFDLALGRGLMLSGTGTLAKSRADCGQITTRDLTSASAALAIAKQGLFARADELRLTVASPMHNVGGQVSYTSYGVVDRMTGELGLVKQSVSLNQRTPLSGQASYGMALANGRGGVSLIGRVDRGGDLGRNDGALGYTAGAQMQLAF